MNEEKKLEVGIRIELEERLRAVLLEILQDYDKCDAISVSAWQKACDLLGIGYDLEPLK